jgi:hypothetical protein
MTEKPVVMMETSAELLFSGDAVPEGTGWLKDGTLRKLAELPDSACLIHPVIRAGTNNDFISVSLRLCGESSELTEWLSKTGKRRCPQDPCTILSCGICRTAPLDKESSSNP